MSAGNISRYRIAYLFLVPTFVFILLFSYYPSFSAVYYAFFRWNGADLKEFVGLGNFGHIFFENPQFRKSVLNLLIFLSAGILQMIPSVVIATVLFHVTNQRAQYIYRNIFVLPMVVPGMVSMLLWKFIYNPQVGLLNRFLAGIGAVGSVDQAPTWLADPRLAIPCLIFMGFPWVNSIAVLIYLAGLQRIPRDIFDSCAIDGAGALVRFFRIELPLIMGQIKLMLILGLIGGIQDYGKVLIMTGGGPGDATIVPGLLMYKRAFEYSQLGYGAAIGVILFLAILSLTTLSMKYVRTQEGV